MNERRLLYVLGLLRESLMSERQVRIWFLAAAVLIATGAWSQSIHTDDDIETDGQLVSNVAKGTAPLAVSSPTVVPNLNADLLDGLEGAALALDEDLQNVETILLALQAQVNSLGLSLVRRTGQTTCYGADGAEITCGTGIGLAQDGHLQLGVTWPNPRFTKNGDGTVKDNLTGLVWLENANCADAAMTWQTALDFANTLFDGSTDHNGGDCGLSDESKEGAWRLPNMLELQSLVHFGVRGPAVPNTAGTGQWSENDPFSGVQSFSFYWSSSTVVSSPELAWVVFMDDGGNFKNSKTLSFRVWLVRGGQ